MDSSNPLSAIQLPIANPPEADPSGGNATSQNPAPVQTPPLAVMMQQAVAMQQFQFQQALLMQQVITAQQAATRAATLKSAAEMAAARAAEISKQLKGDDVEDGKHLEKSKSRSLSKSASRSPSRSRSKSRSRSPIRYRRGRSNSRSPIRYRRDYYSPSRSRDYYGYRSRGYRGYYWGGRSEYARSMYRRERDRDNYFRSSRQSGSRGRRRSNSRSPRRSRSRGRRRSRTPSRSPRHRRSRSRLSRHRREKSVSPKHKRDERKLYQTSKRSVSREAARSHSAISGSASGSPPRKDGSKSPSTVKGGSDKLSNAESPLQTEGKRFSKDSSHSSSQTEHSDHMNEGSIASSFRKTGSPSKPLSSSKPVMSSSVSVDDEQNEVAYPEHAQERSPDRDSELHMRVDRSVDPFKIQNNLKEAAKGKVGPKELDDKDFPLIVPNQEANFSLEECAIRKSISVSNAYVGEESEYDEDLDDWRDDLKPAAKENENLTYGSIDARKMVENEERMNLPFEAQRPNFNVIFDSKLNMSTSDDGGIHVSSNFEEERNDKISTGSMLVDGLGTQDIFVTDHADKVGVEDDLEVKDDAHDLGENVIFEGPKPVNEDEEEMFERIDSVRAETEAYVAETVSLLGADGDKGCMIVHDQERMHEMMDSEEGDDEFRDKAGNLERDDHKGKHRSHSKDSKKHEDDLAKHEKQRDHRHKKHKRKHRHEDADEEKVEGADERKDEGHRARKRHRKKHKRESEHGHKEKKKRKHKHRAKSPSGSAEENLTIDKNDGKDDEELTVMKKKSSKRHKKSKRDLSESAAPSATSSG